MDVSKSQNELNDSSNKNTQLGYEDLKNKLKILEADNQKMNEQIFSLQNKFYVQSKILNDKNIELSKEVSEKQKIKVENEKIEKESSELKIKLESMSKEKEELTFQNKKYKDDLNELNQKYNDSNLKSKYLIGQLEEQNSLLASENNNLKDNTVKLQSKIDYINNENKARESKLLFSIKNENKEIIINLRKELSALQKYNDELLQENIKIKNIIEKNNKKEKEREKENILDSTVNTSYIGGGNITENRSVIMFNLENNIKNLKDDINMYKEKIKEMEENELSNDKKLKAMKLDLKQSESDIKNYIAHLKEKDIEINSLQEKIKELLTIIEKSKNVDNLNVEINEKNQTINFLLSQLEDIKRNLNLKSQNFEEELNNIKNEKNMISRKLEENNNENEKKRDEYLSKLNDLQSENNILINDLNKKEEGYSKLLEEKIQLENKCNIQFEEQKKKFDEIHKNVEDLSNENENLKNKIAECAEIAGNQFHSLNDSVIKSSVKIESLMNVYNNHINFLKQRFENLLNDLNIIVSIQNSNPNTITEKFNNVINAIKTNLDLVTKMAESESLIKNFKTEVKTLKNNLDSSKSKIKFLEQENEELTKTLNVQKLRMKIKPQEKNKLDGTYSKLVNKMKDYLSITQLNIQNSNLFSENENQKAQIKYLTENNNILKERNENLEKMVKDLKLQIENKSNEIVKDTKNNKIQIKLLMDQLIRIKETWTPLEKKMEYLNQIEELEKNIKELKSDINRKKELISTLKSQNEEKQQKIYKYDLESNNDINSVISNNIYNNKEIQNLKGENLKKIKEIKELKRKIDKLNSDKQILIEKNKINKVDVNRKDEIINDLKSKISILKNDNDKLNVSINDEQQKLLDEIKKKEKSITILKRNNETLKRELQLYQKNNSENENNSKKVSKEILSKDEELEGKNKIINSISTCLRMILKDLSKKYETEKNKMNLKGMNNTVKEEMLKLGLDDENIGEFIGIIGKDENINKASEQIDILLNDIGKFNSEKAFKLYNILFDSLRELETENINNNNGLISFNNFNRSGNTSNNMLALNGNDNSYSSGKIVV